MKTVKLSTDELMLIETLIYAQSKKHSQKGAMQIHYTNLKRKIVNLYVNDENNQNFVVTSMSLEESTKLMQDIKTNIMHGDVTDSKRNVLNFVANVWNRIFESSKSMFENQS